MTEKITESVYTKKFIAEATDPYILALKVMDIASKHGKIIEKRNTYETDGPVKEAKMSSDLIVSMNKYSRVKFTVEILGRTNSIGFISIDITAESQIRLLQPTNILSETFYVFFMKNLYPVFYRRNYSKIKEITYHLEREISQLLATKPQPAAS